MQEARSVAWGREHLISAGMLESVHGLNSRFLELATMGAPHLSAADWNPLSQLGLPAGVSAQLLPLSAAQKTAAASCPYALFDLRFGDDVHWQTRFSHVGGWGVADEARAPDETLNFVRLALFFAWHVASTGRLAAQWLLGMADGTLSAFQAATIDCLPALAASEAVHLTARWSTCPAYWGALAGAAARHNPARLRRVQLCGLQLVAAARLS